MGLYDMVLIKDNHIDMAGGIAHAIHQAVTYMSQHGSVLEIEIEARTLDDVRSILKAGRIHRILLDNFTIPETRAAVELIGGAFETESSGGIHLDNIRDYALCGVDYISVGALTHHIRSLDLSLKMIT
jgi:nicotinate-nucleotide pyrophosphorylase (carboxylating)